jgi:hypothetical protein
MNFRVSPVSAGIALGAAALVLILLHLLAVFVLRIAFGYDFAYGFVEIFDLDAEASVPTWFSLVLILTASLASLLAGINDARRDGGRGLAIYWFVLSGALCFISLDEQAQLHETLSAIIKTHEGDFFIWVVIYAPFAGLFGIFFLRFLFFLPRSTAIAFVAGGATYMMGAVGFELVESWVAGLQGDASLVMTPQSQDRALKVNVPYQIAVTVQESLEILGMTIYLVAVLGYLARRGVRLEISLVGTGAGQTARQRGPIVGVRPAHTFAPLHASPGRPQQAYPSIWHPSVGLKSGSNNPGAETTVSMTEPPKSDRGLSKS